MRLRVVFVLLACLAYSTSANAQMSEGEKKAAARAAYTEGVQLQDQGKPADALSRFEAAQGLYDAPTHLLHIAECQALTGKLVEASETYETLIRRPMPPGSPEVFVQAQDQGKAELPPLRQRIPTLRVTTKPDSKTLQSLVIVSNGRQLPDGIVGIARPVNPGPYEISASASGYGTKEPVKFELREKETKSVELTMVQGATGFVVAPPGPAPGGTPTDAPPVIEDKSKERAKQTPSSTGLLLGAHVGAFVPSGDVAKNVKFESVGSAGPGVGIDLIGRFARFVTIGGTLEFVSFGGPDSKTFAQGAKADVSTTSVYLGANAGILPNIDKFSFVADIGLGYRFLNYDATVTAAGARDAQKFELSYKGVEVGLNAGVSIPAGPIRVIPKAGISYGTFTDRSCDVGLACSSNIAEGASHTIFSVGVGVFYNLDLSKKAASSNTARASDPPSTTRTW